MLALGLVIATAFAYAEVRNFAFVNFDDDEYVYDNPQVTAGLSWAGLRWAFTAVHSANWHPLTWLSHMLDASLFGLEPGGHHATNVLLHTLATLCLFAALRSMTGAPGRSAFVAALFALHPQHVESVAWVAERKDVLSALFWTAAMWAYAAYARRPSARRYGAVALLFALGLLAKPMVVTLPFALLLLDVWPLGRTAWAAPVRPPVPAASVRRLVLEKLPLLALSAVASGITFVAQQSSGAMSTFEALPLGVRVANAAVSYATYLLQTVWPVDLAVFYPYRNPLPTPEVLLAVIALVALSALAVASFPRRPYLLVGWLWYLGTLVPVIGLIRVGEQAMADRFTYLPHIGLFLAVTWGAAELGDRLQRRQWLVPAAVASLIACLALTRAQAQHWRDSTRLFEHARRVTRNNYLAETNLAAALLDAGRPAEALLHARAAVELRPGDSRAHMNLGTALARTGEPDAARAAYERALALDPDHISTRLNLALLHSEQKRFEESVRQYETILAARPEHAKALSGLGFALASLGQPERAAARFRAAIAADPRLTPAYNGLALALESLGETDEALRTWRRGLEIAPGEWRLRANLAAALVASGRSSEAEMEYRALLSERPESTEVRVAFAELLAALGRRDEAIRELRTARARSTSDLATAIDARLASLGVAP